MVVLLYFTVFERFHKTTKLTQKQRVQADMSGQQAPEENGLIMETSEDR